MILGKVMCLSYQFFFFLFVTSYLLQFEQRTYILGTHKEEHIKVKKTVSGINHLNPREVIKAQLIDNTVPLEGTKNKDNGAGRRKLLEQFSLPQSNSV